jgi:hypothetical protein
MVWYDTLIGCKPRSTYVFKETLRSHSSEDKDYDLPECDAMMVLKQVSLLQREHVTSKYWYVSIKFMLLPISP